MLAQKQSSDTTKEARVELGTWLKDCRVALGLSQRELAEALELEYYTFISQLENGRGKIPAHRYGEWATVLGQDPRAFVTRLLKAYEPDAYAILFGDTAA